MSKTRDEIPEQDRWNVAALYSDPENWKSDLLQTRGQEKAPYWPELKTYQGKLSDPKIAASFFDYYFTIDRKLAKLHTYAHLRLDEDLGNDLFKHDFGLISTLLHEFQLESSWIEPEILSLPEADYRRLTSHPSLKSYQFYLEKLGRMRPHTLTPEMEELMALSGKALDTAYRAFGALNNADMTFKPALDSEGKEYPLSNGTYLSYLRHPDRNVRKTAFQNLHQAYEAHANSLCELIQGQVQSHLFFARARKFDTCLDAALYPHAVDRSVYTNLIASVRRNLPLMHEYIAMRKKQMQLDAIHVYDLYVPLVDEVDIKMSYPEACQTVVDSVALLGSEYQAALRKGLMEDRWVDVFENARKRSGAYSSGCYDSMPYILLNYHGNFTDVQTLAHEAGHSMHSYLSRNHQPYIYSQYSIFVAEVASTFNEQLLLSQVKRKAKNKQERAYLINDEIERIRGTIFRQTLFAEFELQLHEWAEAGVPLTPALLKKKYLELNRDYYGPDIVLDSELEIEWARIPHFYYNFYVYQYATGLSAAMALYQKALQSKEARQRYLEFLSSGGSRYPLDLLERAGVNMRSPEPVDAALQRFGELVRELKENL
jgi:oligoendopeptidase F